MLAIIEINKNANKKKIKINRITKITIITETIILTIKNSIENIENLKKKFDNCKDCNNLIKIKIITKIIVNNNNQFFLEVYKYCKYCFKDIIYNNCNKIDYK